MASSNRHWPSLFKSKPHNQWQHDHVTSSHSSLLSPSPCQKPNSYSSSGLTGAEERSPDPKPRWNPKPEQIQILEAIFNSGMVNPPRDEIRRIRAQLQEYGQVGDANVFYWFQNRKSRSKNKLRSSSSSSSSSAAAAAARAHAQSRGGSSAALLPPPPMISLPPVTAPVTVGPTSSSSSSSERSTGGSDKSLPPPMVSTVVASSHSPTGSVNQTYLQSPSATMTTELFVEPTGVYLQGSNQGFYVSSAAAAVAAAAAGELMPAGFWTELMMGQELWRSGGGVVHDLSNNNTCTNMHNPNPNGCGGVTGTATTAAAATSVTVTPGVAAHVNEIVQGELGCHEVVGGGGGAKSTVFINGVGFEVGLGPVNVREAFGEDAVLIHCSGHPVLTDDWGLTLQPLQHGASYYLV